MEIKYLGHSAFYIKSKNARVVFDPFDPSMVGLPLKKMEADVVCVSHDHNDHNFVDGVEGNPYVISGPGEYEVKGVKVTGIPSFHDDAGGKDRGRNSIYLVEVEDVFVCHLGDLGHKLTDNQLKGLEKVDVLLIPVGGFYTIDSKAANEVIAQIEPKMVIPMHFRPAKTSKPVFDKLGSLDDFLKEMGETPRYEKSLTVNKNDFVEEQVSLVVLEPYQ